MIESLYHFTSIESLVSMLSDYSVDNPNFTLWASNALFMNDASEFVYAESVLKEILQQFEEEEGIDEKEAFAYILNNRKSIFNFDALKDIPFIVSLTETSSSAALWDIYAKKGCGIALEFDVEDLCKASTCSLKKCLYCRDSSDFLFEPEMRAILKEIYDYAVKMTPISIGYYPAQAHAVRAYLLLSKFSPIVKNASFAYEQEHRLFSSSNEVKFRTRGNIILPYKEIKLPANIIKKIIIGPCADFEYVAMSMKLYLASKGLHELSKHVECSVVPYRG